MLLRHHSRIIGAVQIAFGLSDKGDLKESCFSRVGRQYVIMEWVEKCVRGKTMVVR